MSSLQRAVQEGKKKTLATGGSFETSFAGGLDFSELTAFGGSHTNGSSSSATLLAVRKAEARQKANLVQEEANLQKNIQQRIKKFTEKRTDRPLRVAPPMSSDASPFLKASGLGGALCAMHSTDTTEQRLKSKRSLMKMGRNSTPNKQNQNKGKKLVKKRGRSKF